MNARSLLLAALFLAASLSPAAARFADNWGEFTREELFSLHYPEDPDADAFVLADHGVARVDHNHRLHFQRHLRTKIFTEAGASRGVIRIESGKDDELKEIRGHTLVPPDRRVKLEGKHVTEEKHGDRRVTTIRFPDVKPGVILELSYELRSDDLRVLPPWHFQGEDYTRRSRFELQVPPGMTYDAFFGWYPGPEPKPVTATVMDPEHTEFKLEEAAWTLKDLAPFRPESHLANTNDYRTTLYVQLQGFSSDESRQSQVVSLGQFESSNKRSLLIATPWPELAAEAAGEDRRLLEKTKGVASWAAPALEGITEPEARARALYRRVRDEIRTAAGPEASLAEVVAAGEGSARAKNLLLLHLLREEGIEADAVRVRTRDHGTFEPRYRDPRQLNHTIVSVRVGDTEHWLDASEPFCPFGVLPPRDLAGQGLVVRPSGGDLVALGSGSVESLRSVTTEATLDAAGRLASRSTWRFTGYEALTARQRIAETDAEEFVRELLRGRAAGAPVTSVEVRSLTDENRPLEIEVGLDLSAFAQSKGSTVRLTYPFLFVPSTNPLAGTDEREYPVQYPYEWSHEEHVVVTPTAGSQVLRSPENVRRRIAEAEFSLMAEPSPNRIDASCRMALLTDTVHENRTADVRAFYEELVAAGEGRFVVKPPSRPTGTH